MGSAGFALDFSPPDTKPVERVTWGWRCGGPRGGVCWGAGSTQASQTGRWESFQSDGVNGLGLDEGEGIDSDRTAVTLFSTVRCHL